MRLRLRVDEADAVLLVCWLCNMQGLSKENTLFLSRKTITVTSKPTVIELKIIARAESKRQVL